MIDVRAAAFRYGDHTVFDDLTLHVAAGELLCLLGPNGSGKTTLLRCMAGMLRPSSGMIEIGGRDVAGMSPRELGRAVGIVFQEHVAAFPFTVRDVVRMGRAPHLGLLAAPGRADGRMAVQTLAEIGIEHLADRPYTQISGGERQLVLIARALCQQPDVLLLDEPTSHLDLRNTIVVLRTLRTLTARGIAVVMTTHAPDHPLLLGGDVALLRAGEFVALGPAATALTTENLRTTFDADLTVVTTSLTGPDGPLRVVVPQLADPLDRIGRST